VEQEKAALMARDAEWSKIAGDPAKFVTYFATDGVLALAGMPELKGPAAINQALTPLAKAPGFSLKWTPTRADVSASGDLGYTAGTYEMSMNNAAGLPATEKGKYNTTWKKIDGTWKVVYDSGSPDAATPISSAHVVVPAAKVAWGDPPPSVPKGAKIAAIAGDPTKAEPFTIRLQLPAGYRIPPHWHPTDEHVTVLSGTFAAGMGKAWDDKAMADLPAGSYAVLSATMPHYALAKTAAVVQVHGMGPFVLNYVNPADDPSKAK
jgi:ketosteroid isomerase-like protein/quercetin dioxygenase-like cupin family protein